jgi:hypothetical protein
VTLQDRTAGTIVPYQDNQEHVIDALRWLDLLLALRVTEFRHRRQAQDATAATPSLQGEYVMHERIDWLLKGTVVPEAGVLECLDLRRQLNTLQREIEDRVAESLERGVDLALPRLAQMFGLSEFEVQTLVVCLAPELDRKYDTIYAYLQDDITRKRPSVDLVLNLFCDSEATRWRARTLFFGHSPLFRSDLLRRSDDPQSAAGSSGLAQFLKLEERILRYILGETTAVTVKPIQLRMRSRALAFARANGEVAAAAAVGATGVAPGWEVMGVGVSRGGEAV